MNPQTITDDSNTLTNSVLLETNRFSRFTSIGARGTLTLDGANNLSFVADKPEKSRYNFNVPANTISHLNLMDVIGGRIAITTADGVVHSFAFYKGGFQPEVIPGAAAVGVAETIERAEVWSKALREIVPADKQQNLEHAGRFILIGVGVVMLIAFIGIFLGFYFGTRGH